jgi:anti-sigma B factor antagonist
MREDPQLFAVPGGLACRERHAGGVTILDLEGSIIIGEGTDILRRETRRLIKEGRRDLLLNLSRVRFVDSAGLGGMIAALLAARRAGGEVALLAPRPNVLEVIEVTRLVRVFDIYADEQSALAGMGGGRG